MRKTVAVLCFTLLTHTLNLWAQPASVATQPDSQPDESAEAASWSERETLTDDWFTLGKRLADRGLTASLTGLGVYQQNLHGGLSTHRRAGRFSGAGYLELNGDLEKMLRIPGAAFYALGRSSWSDGIDASSVGSVFGANGYANGDRAMDLAELFAEQSLADGKVKIRVGKLDLTGGVAGGDCVFDTNNFANDGLSQFLNGALVNNPTIPFPDGGLGAVVRVQPVDWWYVMAGAADAQADARETGFNTAFHGRDDFFAMAETGVTPTLSSPRGPLAGAYRVGGWYDPQPKEHFDGHHVKRDDAGLYVSADQMICRENDAEDDTQGFGLFGRFGLADGDVNEVSRFWSVGGQYQGLIRGRDDDVLGLGLARGRLSRDAGYTRSHETAAELYYKIQVAPWLTITPSVQWILAPGGDRDVHNAVVVGGRVVILF